MTVTYRKADTLLGKYKIIKTLGSGGWGDVYLAEDTRLGRKIAIKHLRPELTKDKIALARFLREARIIAGLKHRNIVTIFALESDGDDHYMIMEYAENGTLEDLIEKEGQLSIATVLDMATDICLALDVVHTQEIIHRDIKPSNILLFEDSEGNVSLKLADFGVARAPLSEQDPQLTADDSVLGSAIYMAPEQAQGKSVDARSDIYSTGVLLYEVLTGKLPHTGNYVDILLGITERDPISPKEIREDTPDALDQLVMKALSKDPTRRFQTARAMAETLQSFTAELKKIYDEGLTHLEQKEWQEAVEKFTQLTSIDPTYPDAEDQLLFAKDQAKSHQLYQKGERHFQNREWDDAVRFFREALLLQPDFPEAEEKLSHAQLGLNAELAYNRGLRFIEQSQWEDGIAKLVEANASGLDFPDLPEKLTFARQQQELESLHQEALQYEEAGQWVEAIAVLENICTLDEKYKKAHERLAAARYEYELQEAYVEHRHIPQEFVIENNRRWDRWAREAANHEKNEDWGKAVHLYMKIWQENSNYPELPERLAKAKQQRDLKAAYELAENYLEQEEWVLAKEQFDMILREAPNYRETEAKRKAAQNALDVEALFNEGCEYLNQKNYAKALERFDQVLVLAPNHQRAIALKRDTKTLKGGRQDQRRGWLSRLGDLFTGSDRQPPDYEDTRRDWKKKQQDELQDLYKTGVEYFDSERWENAATIFRDIVNRSPGFKDAEHLLDQTLQQLHLAETYDQASEARRLRRWHDAVKALEDIVGTDADYRDAAELLNQVRLEIQIEDTFEKTRSLFENQQWAKTIIKLEKLLVQKPDHREATLLLAETRKQQELAVLYEQAVSYESTGDWDQAVGVWEQIAAVQPNLVDVAERLSQARQQQIIVTSSWFLSLSCPNQVSEVGQTIRVIINLSPHSHSQDEILITAPHKEIAIQLTADDLALQSDRVLTFVLDDDQNELIEREIELIALRRGHFRLVATLLDSLSVSPRSVEVGIAIRARKSPKSADLLPNPVGPRPGRQPDLTIRVYVTPPDDTHPHYRFQYVGYSPLSRLRLPGVPLGSVNFPPVRLNQVWAELADLSRCTTHAPANSLQTRLSALGKRLYTTLFPKELRQLYYEGIASQVESWLILCETEPWIPWELVKPCDGENEEEFLGMRFATARTIEGLGIPRQYEFPLGLVNLTLDERLEPYYQPPEWEALFTPDIAPGQPSPPLHTHSAGYLSLTQYAAPVWGQHFVGVPDSLARGSSALVVPADQLSLSEENVRSATLDFWSKRPLITFGMVNLNGQSSLTQMEQQWVPTFIKTGIGAFVGTLWTTAPRADRLFWRTFYRAIWSRQTLGEAVLVARQAVQQTLPDSLDHLAYFAVGDPMARGYIPKPGEGYAWVECQSYDLARPLQLNQFYLFHARIKHTPPTSYHGRRYQTEPGLIQAPHLQVFAPQFDIQPGARLTLQKQDQYFEQSFRLSPRRSGEHDLFFKFYDGDNLLQTIDLTVEVERGSP
jgi:serine/threonine protein kinase/Tfp pilus assembly protein PilF